MSLFFPLYCPTARQRAVMKALERIIIGGHVFVLVVVTLLLADCPVHRFVLATYHVMHTASIPAELLYVFVSLRLRTSFVPDDESPGRSQVSSDTFTLAPDQA